MYFENRTDAGRRLAELLAAYKNGDAVVYALPRGGVLIGKEIAARLAAPLELVIPRKVGHPMQPEYAVCAVAEDGDILCDQAALAGLSEAWLNRAIALERREAQRRRLLYSGGRKPLPAAGKTAIIVDDGVATGLTLMLAISEIKHQGPKNIVAAVPVVPAGIAEKIRREVDELVALEIPEVYRGAVGMYYKSFLQVEDDEVVKIMRAANRRAFSH